MSPTCHVCVDTTDDSCVRCSKPTCAEHFFDQEYLGVCQPCVDEIDAAGGPMSWPYPLRKEVPDGWRGPTAGD